MLLSPGRQQRVWKHLHRLLSTNRLSVGSQFILSKKFDHQHVQQFLVSTGDTNPIHSCPTAAQQAGFPRPILPGVLVASLFPAVIGSNFPGAVYAKQTLEFKAPALVGCQLEAEVTVSKVSGSKVVFDTRCYAADTDSDSQSGSAGRTLVVKGEALAILTTDREV